MLAGLFHTFQMVRTTRSKQLSSQLYVGASLIYSCTVQPPCKRPLFVQSATLLLEMIFRLRSLSRLGLYPLFFRCYLLQKRVSGKKRAGRSPTSPLGHLPKFRQSSMPTSFLHSSTSFPMPTSKRGRRPAGQFRTQRLAVFTNQRRSAISSRKVVSSHSVTCSL